ncbi:hypothetical protein AAZX31_19G119700 [Glycine max]|uniref:Uncharacterized protein n=1 Tax=Glycine soja TaxID=3848 RepID=A0A0B2Q4I5_GLYSO|nr:hypothetical protein JHK86_053353 [Glycine max]KAG4915868.1 hypothetical protein JHK87_053425 [Glycine soja]KAG5083334.1 hypothetical protein JHK84_053372 [Glycine max]KAG5086105.1 hypothetical protein JHK82_053502 [Glycine max]KHN14919.1 hypothetical protein glysoja_024039 [Glycine soja]
MMMVHPRDQVGGDTHKNLVAPNVAASKKARNCACMVSYSVLILAVLTLFILLLPLVLPPLPPPPLLLLFVPVFLLVVLFFLAFSPSTLPNMAVLTS